MRNNPTTITTETVAEAIVRGQQPTTPGYGDNAFEDAVDVVKERLDRIAQVTGVDKDHVLGEQSVNLIDAYEDKLARGVYVTSEDLQGVEL